MEGKNHKMAKVREESQLQITSKRHEIQFIVIKSSRSAVSMFTSVMSGDVEMCGYLINPL